MDKALQRHVSHKLDLIMSYQNYCVQLKPSHSIVTVSYTRMTNPYTKNSVALPYFYYHNSKWLETHFSLFWNNFFWLMTEFMVTSQNPFRTQITPKKFHRSTKLKLRYSQYSPVSNYPLAGVIWDSTPFLEYISPNYQPRKLVLFFIDAYGGLAPMTINKSKHNGTLW